MAEAKRPGLGFPQVFNSDAELEAAYRFFNNQSLSFEGLLAPHIEKSLERCRNFDEVLCIQDTTTFVFSGEREGLGYINSNNRGFLGHLSLAVTRSCGEPAIPLGVVDARTWTRTTPRKSKDIPQHKLRRSGDCESLRWLETVQTLEAQFGGIASPIHVMDREGDIYDSISTMVVEKWRFVVRCKSNRVVESEDPEFHLLFDALDGLSVRCRNTISVAPRKASSLPDQNRTYPARNGREAEVCVTATTVTVKRTRNSSKEFPATTTLNVVHVFERCPPPNQAPVEWILLTNEPISTNEEVHSVVECYRQRWLIEELNKAIKTGCVFEKRQLESYRALQHVLAMTLPIAWSMLLLRTQSRSNQNVPAKTFIDPLRLKVIRAHAVRYKLPETPTLRDVAYAIAGLGGHLKRNGPPGWQTLRRGYERLLTLEEAWEMASQTCDQS
ncbi:MAG: IS4 family transposase [Deltaproteobacteria bacterium]|nr:IS4 family transposase [Deltaproteobacteria bacterium]